MASPPAMFLSPNNDKLSLDLYLARQHTGFTVLSPAMRSRGISEIVTVVAIGVRLVSWRPLVVVVRPARAAHAAVRKRRRAVHAPSP